MSAQAQTYTYKPLNLDTSSFWVQQYRFSQGLPYISVHGQVLQYVEKDTVINTKVFHKIRGYCTVPSYQQGNNPWVEPYYSAQRCYSPEIYIREDTIQKKVFTLKAFSPFDEDVILDYNLVVNDTMLFIWNDTNSKLNVDSIYLDSFFGVTRKVYENDSLIIPGGGIYQLVEGAGSSHNFPDYGSSEWRFPMFTLQYYNQFGSVQYNPAGFPVDSCYKRPRAISPCWPLELKNISEDNMDINYFDNRIKITHNKTSVEFKVFSYLGQLLFEKEISETYYEHDFSSLPNGIYIINIQSDKERVTKKILIQ